MSRKCFLIDCDQEEGPQLYFAATAGKAKAMVASEEGIKITEISSCHRRPEYDQYAEQGYVPPRILIDDGWHFECTGCSRQIYGDEEGDNGNPLTIVFDGRHVWCSGVCRARQEVREAQWKVDEAEMRLRVEVAVAAKFPGLTVGRTWKPYHRPAPMCQLFLGYLHIADWELGDTHVWLAPVNREKWNEYEDLRLADRPLREWEDDGGAVAA